MPIEESKETTPRELPNRRRHRRHGLASTDTASLPVGGAGNPGCHCGRHRHRRAFANGEPETVSGDQSLGR